MKWMPSRFCFWVYSYVEGLSVVTTRSTQGSDFVDLTVMGKQKKRIKIEKTWQNREVLRFCM